MPRPTLEKTYQFFGSMVDDVGTKVEEGKSLVAQNFYRRRNKFVSRLGTQIITTLSDTTSDVDLFQWAKINGTEYLILLQDGNVLDGFVGGTPLSGGTARFSEGDDGNAAWVEQHLICGTGKAQNVRWNGNNVAQCLPDTAPVSGVQLTAVASGLTSNLTAGTYSYRFAFISADGQYAFPSDPTSGITVNSNSASAVIHITGIPVPIGTQDSIGTAVFRTKFTGGDYFLAATLPSGATEYYDNLADLNLGTLSLQLFNTRFPPCEILIEHQNRMYGAGCFTSEGDRKTVYISNILQFQYCPVAPNSLDNSQGTTIPLQDIAGGVITGLLSHGSIVMVFTGGAAFILQGTNPNEFFLSHLTNHGCCAHRSAVSFRHMAIWLSWDGVYLYDGLQVLRISDDQYNTLLGEASNQMALASAFMWDEKYFLCFPDRTLVYDLLYQQWSVNTNWIWKNTTVTTYTSDKKPRIYAAQTGTGQLWQCEVIGLYTDNGGPIPLQWDSGDENLGLSYRTKRVDYIGMEWKITSGSTIATINLYKGAGELIQTETYDISTPRGPGSTISRFLARAIEQARDEFFRLELKIQATQFVEFVLAEMHFILSD